MCFSSRIRANLLLVPCIFTASLLCAAGVKDSGNKDSGVKSQEIADVVYKPGADVKAPKLIHYVEPEFSDSSDEAFVDGIVKISTVVTQEGVPTDLRVLSSLNSKEDTTAVNAVKQWRFQPGTRNGEAVRVQVTVEVSFHLL